MRNEMRETTLDSGIEFLRQHCIPKSTYQAHDLLLFLDMASSVNRALEITRSAELTDTSSNN